MCNILMVSAAPVLQIYFVECKHMIYNSWPALPCIGKYDVSSYSVLYRQCVLILNVT